MRVFSYVVEHDLGFAPNPYHGACSLACCKPRIRKSAQLGDLILGMGSVKTKLNGRLTFWMMIDEILNFDQYWDDPRFRRKRPIMSASKFLRYGDNIYHKVNGEFQQLDSFHSEPNGVLSVGNRRRDTGATEKVLISHNFAYWGAAAISVPKALSTFCLPQTPGHKSRFSEEDIASLLKWLKTQDKGILGEPADWLFAPSKSRRVSKRKEAQ